MTVILYDSYPLCIFVLIVNICDMAAQINHLQDPEAIFNRIKTPMFVVYYNSKHGVITIADLPCCMVQEQC